ncbi:hypothetical protein [Streptomyces sp. NPDC004291]
MSSSNASRVSSWNEANDSDTSSRSRSSVSPRSSNSAAVPSLSCCSFHASSNSTVYCLLPWQSTRTWQTLHSRFEKAFFSFSDSSGSNRFPPELTARMCAISRLRMCSPSTN